MARKNAKNVVVNLDTSIKKSNEISLSKMNKGFTLNQMQLLSFAIFNTQKDGSTKFNKASFEKQFGIGEYRTNHAVVDAEKLLDLKISYIDLGNDRFGFSNVFMAMQYDRGTFVFEWNPKFIPHILDLQGRYLINDLTISANFKSSFSWILYELLKSMHNCWHKQFSKEELFEIFNVQDVKSYQKNMSLFKKKVLDLAIAEVNQYTELEIHYKELKKGRAIVGFDIHWSTGKIEKAASEKLIDEIKAMIDAVRIDISHFVTLRDTEARDDAIRVFNLIMDKANELNESLSKEKAQSLHKYIKLRMNELNKILVATQTKVNKSSIFYNWLDERE